MRTIVIIAISLFALSNCTVRRKKPVDPLTYGGAVGIDGGLNYSPPIQQASQWVPVDGGLENVNYVDVLPSNEKKEKELLAKTGSLGECKGDGQEGILLTNGCDAVNVGNEIGQFTLLNGKTYFCCSTDALEDIANQDKRKKKSKKTAKAELLKKVASHIHENIIKKKRSHL